MPAPGADGLVEFRDVFEVDGKPVRDREDRLARLFLQRSPTADDQIRTIVVERRALQHRRRVPRYEHPDALPLLFLDRAISAALQVQTFERHRAAARHAGSMKSPRFTPLPGLWVVEHEETARNTLIQRGQIGGDMPARGRFWIEPDTGRVVISEVIVSDPLMRATIDVALSERA